MTKFIKAIEKKEYKLQAKMEFFFAHHKVLGFFAAFVGMPVAMLGGIFAVTATLAYPMAVLFGWV